MINQSLPDTINLLIKTSKAAGVFTEMKIVNPLVLSDIEKKFDLPYDLSLFYSII